MVSDFYGCKQPNIKLSDIPNHKSRIESEQTEFSGFKTNIVTCSLNAFYHNLLDNS